MAVTLSNNGLTLGSTTINDWDDVGGSGIATHWIRFIGTGTVAIRDSLNASSLTDNGTGDYTVSFTDNLSNANYGLVIGEGDWRNVGVINEAAITSSDYDILSRAPSNASFLDSSVNSVAVYGDLA
jgi:hypothetical protein